MSRSLFTCRAFTPTGRMEEGSYRDEVQVNPAICILFCSCRVLVVLRACFIMFLQIVVLTVWQAALLSILYYTEAGSWIEKCPKEVSMCKNETEIEKLIKAEIVKDAAFLGLKRTPDDFTDQDCPFSMC